MVYQVEIVGLNPFQLVLVGTVLEVSYVLLEIPTGVVADVYSRRLSVIIGYLLVDIGFGLTGLTTDFGVILICQVIWGGGYTFLSGALEAWIADELSHAGLITEQPVNLTPAGQLTLGQVYLRGSQLGNLGALIGIGLGALLVQHTMALPLLVGGGIFLLLAVGLCLTMPEVGFSRTPATERESWGQLLDTASRGFRTVRGQPVLLTMFVIAAFVGAWSESFDRLWTKHLVDNFTLPTIPMPNGGELDQVAWFALIQAAPRRLMGMLVAINSLLLVGALLFAYAQWFGMAFASFWLIGTMRTTIGPLFTGWINQYLHAAVRATVLSMHGQSDAIGQVIGGPLIGLVGTWHTLRSALVVGSLLLGPAIVLYGRLLRQTDGWLGADHQQSS